MLCQSIANKRAEMLELVVVVLIALEIVIFIK
jgi:uncharacterized Rmd1/YagE family protein